MMQEGMVDLKDEPGQPTNLFITLFFVKAGMKDFELHPTAMLIFGDVQKLMSVGVGGLSP